MLQKKNTFSENSHNSLQEIKDKIAKKYLCSYTEAIEDKKTILSTKKLKFIQIINTNEDFEKYCNIMDMYINYIKKHYSPNASSDGCNFRKCFDEETSVQDGKLPMFFVYDKKDRLLGMAGVRTKTIGIDKGDKQIAMQELSVRIMNKNGDAFAYGYGAFVYLTLHLYALNNNIHFFAKTYWQKRDFWFHMFNSLNVSYIKTKSLPRSFLKEKIKMDIFADVKIADVND